MRFFKQFFFAFIMLFSHFVYSAVSVYTQDKPAFTVVSRNPVFVIKLKSNPTTGYAWFLTEYNSKLVESVKHTFEAPINKKIMGAPGYELWTFRIKSKGFVIPQKLFIGFVYKRPWESVATPQQVTFSVSTATKK